MEIVERNKEKNYSFPKENERRWIDLILYKNKKKLDNNDMWYDLVIEINIKNEYIIKD